MGDITAGLRLQLFLWSCTKYQTPFLILESEKLVTISSEDILCTVSLYNSSLVHSIYLVIEFLSSAFHRCLKDMNQYIYCCHKRNRKSNSDASSRLLQTVRIFAQYYILIGSSVRPVNCRLCVRVAD